MNILLTADGIIGKDEYVCTMRPNCYITVLRITPEQAVHFGGNERIGVETQITEEEAGVIEVYGVGDDNKANGWLLTENSDFDDPNPDVTAVLHSLEDREYEAIKTFQEAVTMEEMQESYDELSGGSQLMKILAGMVNHE